MNKLEIKYININDIKPYKKNPRINENAIPFVMESIKKFGFKNPVILDKNNVIVCGHTRIKSAEKLGIKEIPCIYADDLTEEQVKAFRLADNKVSEKAEWDLDLLNDELFELKELDFDMDVLGFENVDLNDEEQKEIVEDDVPELPKEAITKYGDIWQLGEHRLMCGDSTKKEDVEKLMDGKKADLVFTDPPYGMKKEKDGVLNDNLNYDDLLVFNKKWIPLTFEALKDNGSWYCWGIDEPLMDIYAFILKPMIKKNEITFRNLLTWDKNNGQGQLAEEFRMYPIADEKCLFVMCGTQAVLEQYSPYFNSIRDYMREQIKKTDLNTCKKINIALGVNADGGGMASHYFSEYGAQYALPTNEMYNKLKQYAENNGFDAFRREYDDLRREYDDLRAYFDNTHDNMNNVWHFDRTSQQERELTGEHATPKPIALCSRAIKSSSRKDEIVLDVFGGSGSTLIACEQLNRKCYMMELDPKYCDVIITRWETLTGKKAELIKE